MQGYDDAVRMTGGAMAAELRREVDRRVSAGETPGVSLLRESMDRLMGSVPSVPVDRSRPVGQFRRALLTPWEVGIVGEGPSREREEALSAIGLPRDVSIYYRDFRHAAGCWECTLESIEFDLVYHGGPVPAHVVPPAAPTPAGRPGRPAPESIS